MKNIKTFKDFIKAPVNEAFQISLDQLPSIGDIVDKVDWNEGDKMAFIDFKGIKNIPVAITDQVENSTEEIEQVEEIEQF